MCIIISKPHKKILPKFIYEESFRVNDDGAGIAYILNKDIVVEKGFFKFDDFYEAVKKVEHLPLLIHCRITSHGPTNKANCHPFVFKPENSRYQWVMAHNGVLAWASTQKQSDTSCFCEDVLWPLVQQDPDFLEKIYGQIMLERMINDRNKMVIIRYDKEENSYSQYILNKNAGNTAHGCWFSNYSWKPYTQPNHVGMGGLGYGYGDDDWKNYNRNHRNYPDPIKNKSANPVTVTSQLQLENQYDTYGWTKNKQGCWVHLDTGIALIDKGRERVKVADKLLLPFIKPESKSGSMIYEYPDSKKEEAKGSEDKDGTEDLPNLSHLSKAERVNIRKFASDFLKAAGIEPRGLADMAKIVMLREGVREMYPSYKELSDVKLDEEIVKMDQDAVITVTKNKFDEEAAEARELEKAGQGV